MSRPRPSQTISGLSPPDRQPGIGLRPGGERPELEPFVELSYAALYESIAAHSRLGLNVVVDVGHHDNYSRPHGFLYDCARRIKGLPALLVGVRCPIETILIRRRDTGWGEVPSKGPIPEPILRWQRDVHIPGIYDLEVDTSLLSPEQCAAAIQVLIDNVPTPSAFERLVVSAFEKLSI